MKAAARLFPVLPPKSGVPVDSLVPYRDEHKALLQKLKDFTTRARGSGPEVHQSLGYLPALALAGHLHPVVEASRDAVTAVSLVPVPCREFSEAHPGQFSLRLAHRVARFLGIPLFPVFHYGTGGPGITYKHSRLESVDEGSELYEHLTAGGFDMDPGAIVLDDQCTAGRSMKTVLDSLDREGWQVVKAMTWSQSMQVDVHRPSGCFFRKYELFWNDCFCPHVS
jgi:hypothetical protein